MHRSSRNLREKHAPHAYIYVPHQLIHQKKKRGEECLESIGREMIYGITGVQPPEILTRTFTSCCDYPLAQESKSLCLGEFVLMMEAETHTEGWELPSVLESFKSPARGTHLNSFFLWPSRTCCHSSACQAGGQSIWLQACKEWGFGSLHWWAAGADAPGCWQDTSLVWIPTPQDAEQRLQGPLCHLSQKEPKTHL